MATYTNLLFHIIYSTKFRKSLIQPDWQNDLYGYIGGILRENHGTLLRIGGVSDHVHILAKLSPTLAVSDVLRVVKANSSKWVNDRVNIPAKFQWQSGFAAFSVSESQVPVLEAYIAKQELHHLKISFEEEFLQVLRKHKIQFDPRYVFEQEIVQ